MRRMGAMQSKIRIRRAQPEEAELLTALIMRSKAHWGYEPALLDVWRSDLALDSAMIARDPVYCAEDLDGIVVGVSHLYLQDNGEVYLDHLFTEPASMGQGIGSCLWHHTVEQTALLQARALVFEADPNARPFYEHMGASVVGWEESHTVPGRRNPLMRYDLPPS